MKKFFILILAIAAGYLFYKNFFNKKPYEIKENIVVAQSSGMDINAGPAPPPKYAHIEGAVKNIGNKDLKNFSIIYFIGSDSLSVLISMLPAGDSLNFNTNSVWVRSLNPQYKLKEVRYKTDEVP
ncbi:MAG TPA: hypothetical protein VLM39_11930 [Ignavibacteriaceae bacterium]|nr:hypothetical protein [Ignavibacteriaceae bacterium]